MTEIEGYRGELKGKAIKNCVKNCKYPLQLFRCVCQPTPRTVTVFTCASILFA